MGELADGVFVLAVLGASPGVVTELLWHLDREGTPVAGVEIWTTSSEGRRAGRQHLADRYTLFDTLKAAVPAYRWLPHRDSVAHARGTAVIAETCGPPTFRVVTFDRGDGTSLDDVRDADDAELVARQLYDRLRFLCRDEAIPLVASLAGGRKTMSAALHSAIMAHGRPVDRLTHVLVHPSVEEVLGRALAEYGVPNEAVAEQSGVPVDEQVQVYDVLFPWMRRLGVVEADWTYDESWTALRRLGRVEEVVLRQRPERKGWELVLCGVDVVIRVPKVQAQVYAALVRSGDQPLAGLVDIINGERHPTAKPANEKSVKQLLKELTGTLRSLRGRPGLVPAQTNGLWCLADRHLVRIEC